MLRASARCLTELHALAKSSCTTHTGPLLSRQLLLNILGGSVTSSASDSLRHESFFLGGARTWRMACARTRCAHCMLWGVCIALAHLLAARHAAPCRSALEALPHASQPSLARVWAASGRTCSGLPKPSVPLRTSPFVLTAICHCSVVISFRPFVLFCGHRDKAAVTSSLVTPMPHSHKSCWLHRNSLCSRCRRCPRLRRPAGARPAGARTRSRSAPSPWPRSPVAPSSCCRHLCAEL